MIGILKIAQLRLKMTQMLKFLTKFDLFRLSIGENRQYYQVKLDHKARMNIKMSFYIFAFVKYANQLIILASTSPIHLSQRSKIHKII